ncbi:tRNA (adenosine(37)-N6)-threonylcarbamoyltransferase complex dimerization subunit type 1 TsaB [Qipengyuania sp. XHP0211]|uniref:tRNA (adenosine(37)-N6)-threonylcarbamoyltransferase complex dimerization subunit type 1 TsaB n=1 Tax=Qipengyuania sp. XHP0211 TaxID=3038079 RepID=UPI00241D111A|nr:tRNA (adenosine(37)-N6)-threonylcarbamoyltransferase complex dimerization subunit type 1 TsaB [Qipengyuania sp. XHP0211]MDG5750782.1 tRNA (adenosine(37)-N6)-threonylcarbamoyltransferase complex dimerization subunit type 1 TsaB [Qipengyuania sp. XHP0211]
MRILAIETATEACSVALFDDAKLVEARHEVLGRGHAERLVPMIAELPGKGRADRILVSLGPGSFTGVRIGLAVARALGIAWGAEVLGYPTLELIAAIAGADHAEPVSICMNGGHGEWFVQNYDGYGQAEDEVRSLVPDAATQAARHRVLVGNRAKELAALLEKDTLVLELTPDARAAYLLHESSLTSDLAPLYGRGPDAKLPSK